MDENQKAYDAVCSSDKDKIPIEVILAVKSSVNILVFILKNFRTIKATNMSKSIYFIQKIQFFCL